MTEKGEAMTDKDFKLADDTFVVRQCEGGFMCPEVGTEFVLTHTGVDGIVRLTCVNGDFPGLVDNQGFFTAKGDTLTAVFVYDSGEQGVTNITFARDGEKISFTATIEPLPIGVSGDGGGVLAAQSGGGGGGGGGYGGTRP